MSEQDGHSTHSTPVARGASVWIAALVPAAGASRRMGRDKRRMKWGATTLLEATVAALREGGLSPILVVVEPDSPCRTLAGLADCELVENPDPRRGMLSSILCGLDALCGGLGQVDAVAIQPGDHPRLPSSVIAELSHVFAQSRPPLLAPRFNGRRGHPLIIARSLFGQTRRCDPNVGLRQLVWQHESSLRLVDFDNPRADDDVDTPADIDQLDT